MIVKDTFLGKLREAFNLNIYEVKIWTALLSRGISNAGELSEISEVPRSRTYDVLESLEKKGFVIMKLGKPIKYIAVDPEEIIKRVKRQYKDASDNKIQKLEDVKTTSLFQELELLHKQGIEYIDPGELSGCFKGRDSIYDHLNKLLTDAKKSVVIVTTSEGLKRKGETLKKSLRKLKERKVNVRIVAPIDKTNIDIVKELLPYAEIRNTQRINARFAIVDDKDVLFMVLNDKEVHPSYDVGIWITTPYFASALSSLFEGIWTKLEDSRKTLGKLK